MGFANKYRQHFPMCGRIVVFVYIGPLDANHCRGMW